MSLVCPSVAVVGKRPPPDPRPMMQHNGHQSKNSPALTEQLSTKVDYLNKTAAIHKHYKEEKFAVKTFHILQVQVGTGVSELLTASRCANTHCHDTQVKEGEY